MRHLPRGRDGRRDLPLLCARLPRRVHQPLAAAGPTLPAVWRGGGAARGGQPGRALTERRGPIASGTPHRHHRTVPLPSHTHRTATTVPPTHNPRVSPRATVLGPVARGTPPHHRTLTLPPLASPRAQGCTALPHPLPTPHASPHASPHATHVPAHVPAHVSAHMPPMCQPKCEPMRHRGPSPGAAHQPARRAAPARPARAARLRRRAGPHGARCSPWPEPEP